MKVCYLVGYPLGHSLSAVMHNKAFQTLGLDYRFEIAEVERENLGAFAEHRLRSPMTRGASVTIPYKIHIMKYLDALDPIAEYCGSVNTIVNEDGLLKGYNTDGLGAMRSLRESYGSLEGVKAVVIGAGGASRAICYHLSLIIDELTIVNRTLETAEGLAKNLTTNPGCVSKIFARPLRALREIVSNVDMIVNTTPLGMTPDTNSTPLECIPLRPDLFIFDIVYNPPKTKLLKDAESNGARTLGGGDMLVYQGSEAFRLWTGLEAPEEEMKLALKKALGDA